MVPIRSKRRKSPAARNSSQSKKSSPKKKQARIDKSLNVRKAKTLRGGISKGLTYNILGGEMPSPSSPVGKTEMNIGDEDLESVGRNQEESFLAAELHVDLDSKNIGNDEEQIQLLKNFDLNVLYGACCGISRRERYKRALQYQLEPTPHDAIIKILDEHKTDPNYYLNWETSIWDQNDARLRMIR